MEIIRDWWGVITGVVVGVVWLSRLEWRSVKNEGDIRSMQQQRKADLAEHQRERTVDLESASKARDETNHMLDEIRGDIKQLLQRGVVK